MTQAQGAEKRPCPFDDCDGELPTNARYCPKCTRQVVEFCVNCGARIQRPRGYAACANCGSMPEVGGGTPPPPRRTTCRLCGEEYLQGAPRCTTCGRRSAGFKRLCPFCKKEVEFTANSCQSCGRQFPLSIGKLRYSYVVCMGCNRGSELDDWMAARNLPFLFQTERGVKVNCFQKSERAEEVCRHYFGLDDLTAVHTGDDRAPWTFISPELALEYMHNFGCVCGARAWRLAPWIGFAKKAAPPAAEAAKRGAMWFGGHLKGAFNHLAKKGGK